MKQAVAWMAMVALGPVAAVHADGAQPAGMSDVEWAISAAPASIGLHAAVARMADDGTLTTVRAGDNGWTCLVHDPGTPSGHPLCLDRNGLTWLQQVMTGRQPDPGLIGYSYMLKGGTAWSATDPAAISLPQGDADYVRLPPHVMIINAHIAEASGFPSGERHPDTHKPFVLYGGTPFAILIMPLE